MPELYFLVMLLNGRPVVMPEKYTLEQCRGASGSWDGAPARCVPAPKYNCGSLSAGYLVTHYCANATGAASE